MGVRSQDKTEAPRLEETPRQDETPKGLLDFAKRRRGMVSLSALLATLATALGLVPYVLVYLIVLHLFDQPLDEVSGRYVLTLGLAGVGAVVLKAMCLGASEYVSHIAAYDILHELRMELAEKLGTLPLGYFSGRSTGEIKQVVHEDVERVEEGLAHFIPDTVSGIAVPLLTAIVLFAVDWRMALATVALMPVLLLLWRRAYKVGDMEGHNAALARMNAAVVQYVQGMRVIKAFLQAGGAYAKYRDAVQNMSQTMDASYRRSQPNNTAMFVLMRANVFVILPVGTWLYLQGSLDLPTFVLFLILGMGFNVPLQKLIFSTGFAVWQLSMAMTKIEEILAEGPLREPEIPKEPRGHDIEFREVYFGYGEREVLKGVSFTAPRGSVTALVGPSGAGKTTIARLVPRFWDVDGGEIRLGGVDVREISTEKLMDKVAFVFQDVFLFNDTVYENIRAGRPGASREEVLDAARRARVDDFVRALPDGYDTSVGENGARLSGGQRQRISIARAILKDAPVVVLDEATAFVDPENEAKIQEAIGSLTEEKTLIVVAHRLSTITGADQILVVDEGRIAARGTHGELLEESPLYATLWRAHREAQSWEVAEEAETGERPHTPSLEAVAGEEPPAPLENPYCQPPGESFIGMILRLTGDMRGQFRRGIWLMVAESFFIGAPVVFTYLVLLALLQNEVSVGQIWLYMGGLAVSFFLLAFFNFTSMRVAFRVHSIAPGKLRMYLGEHLRRLPLGFFSKNDTGRINAVLTNDIAQFNLVTGPQQFVQAVVRPAMIFAVLLVVDWRLALAAFLGIPLALGVLFYSDRVFDRVWRRQAETRAVANSRMIDYIQGISVIRAFNLSGGRFVAFGRAMDEYRKASVRTITALTPFIVGFTAVLELGFAALVLLGTWLYLAGSITLPALLLFFVFGLVLYAPIMELGELMAYRRMVQNSMRKVNELVNTPLLPEPERGDRPEDNSIEFKNVSFGYEDEKVLKDVSFTIPERGMTALVGPSGSGKTTITYLISRFWDVDEGAVKVGGVDVREMTTETLLSRITTVFQDVYLFEDTVKNNIAFGNPNATEKEVVAAARSARCHDFIMEMSEGYDTVVGEGGSTLSGGEKQRISIARALLKDAPIVLLDEATASIDPENERLIQEALNALVAEKTLVVIAHRLSTVRSADKILVLDEGRVVQEGTHGELIEREGMYRRFWRERERARDWKLGRDGAVRVGRAIEMEGEVHDRRV